MRSRLERSDAETFTATSLWRPPPSRQGPHTETPSRPGQHVIQSVFFCKRWLIQSGLNYLDSHILA